MIEEDRENQWLDGDGYPTEAALKRIREARSPVDALYAARDAWSGYGSVSGTLRPAELEMVRFAQPEELYRYLRFATGGWSGNEDVIEALRENFVAWAMAWKLSASGGLHIFRLEVEGSEE